MTRDPVMLKPGPPLDKYLPPVSVVVPVRLVPVKPVPVLVSACTLASVRPETALALTPVLPPVTRRSRTVTLLAVTVTPTWPPALTTTSVAVPVAPRTVTDLFTVTFSV